MTTRRLRLENRLLDSVLSALLWCAAFGFAVGFVVSTAKWLDFFPLTAPDAVGRVTVERISKSREYFTAFLFFVPVPLAAIWLRGVWEHVFATLTRSLRKSQGEEHFCFAAVAFSLPLAVSPFVYLFTKKELWSIPFPLFIAPAGTALYVLASSRKWFRDLLTPSLKPIHAIILGEASCWLIFRYLGTGRWIAHIRTIVLEIPFLALTLLVFWILVIGLARGMSLSTNIPLPRALESLTMAFVPLLALPVIGLTSVDSGIVIAIAAGSSSALMIAAWRRRLAISPKAVYGLLVWIGIPTAIYSWMLAAASRQSRYVDLFHRGESLGPASDYLRGKIPYLDVFPLHGLMEDGLLDAILMVFLGRNSSVVLQRPLFLGALMIPLLWILGLVISRSIRFSAVLVLIALLLANYNQRALLEIGVIALVILTLRTRRNGLLAIAGVVSSIAVFFSVDTGMYCVIGTTASIVFLASTDETCRTLLAAWSRNFVVGLVAGAAPFAIYLGVHGALTEFLRVTFIQVPSIIDAVWSIPFPDLLNQLPTDPGNRSLLDWAIVFRFVLNPLVIAVSVLVVARRIVQRRSNEMIQILGIITLFAIVTQRSALGRADFAHQWFSTFTVTPLITILAFLVIRSLQLRWAELDTGGRLFVIGFVTLAITASLALFFAPGQIYSSLQNVTGYQARGLPGAPDARGDSSDIRIAALRAKFHRLTSPSEPIYDFSNQPAIYFFANRANPTRFYQVPVISPEEFQREVIDDLEESRPRIVIMSSPEGFHSFDAIDNDRRAPLVADWIRHHYEPFDTVQGVDLWHPKRGAIPVWNPLDDPLDIRSISIDESPLVKSVFPSAGSIRGSGGSLWQSDLAIHNPHPKPIRLQMNYVTDRRRYEKHIQIAAYDTVHFLDVVGGFFAAPGTRGSLWFVYREAQRPEPRIETRDVHENGQPTIERPFDARDAAVANTETDRLLLLGLERETPGHVNLSIVNLGDTSARFRVQMADGESRNDAVVIVGERSSWTMIDVESRLGQTFDSDHPIRIDVLKGAIVGYASIVDPKSGDHQSIRAIPSHAPEREVESRK